MRRYFNTLGNVILKPLTMRQFPIHLHLEHTTYCNLDCKFCNRTKYIANSQHLSLGKFQELLHGVRPQKLSLTGIGEPLMHPETGEMIRLAKRQGALVDLVTNGTLFTPERCREVVESGLDVIRISLDAATSQTYQTIRGLDVFPKILKGIRTLVDTKQQLGAQRPFVRLTYVMMKDNLHEIAQTVALGQELGVDAANFQPLDLIGIEERRTSLIDGISEKDFSSLIHEALAESRRVPIDTNLQTIWNKRSVYWKKYQVIEPYNEGQRRCIFPWFYTYITVNGDVHPCCYLNYGADTIMGNVFETPFEAIWNRAAYQKFRKIIREGKYPHTMCRFCLSRTLGDMLRDSSAYVLKLSGMKRS